MMSEPAFGVGESVRVRNKYGYLLKGERRIRYSMSTFDGATNYCLEGTRGRVEEWRLSRDAKEAV